MAKRNLARELIEGIEEIRAWKRGALKLKSTTVELPRAADVPQIRKALGYSQEEFAALMGVSVGTLRNWEQARREPHGPARSLLLVASTNPCRRARSLREAGRAAPQTTVSARTRAEGHHRAAPQARVRGRHAQGRGAPRRAHLKNRVLANSPRRTNPGGGNARHDRADPQVPG